MSLKYLKIQMFTIWIHQVCLNYAFHTPDKLCFILDLMNGGDLHYHLTQRNNFTEAETRWEIMLYTMTKTVLEQFENNFSVINAELSYSYQMRNVLLAYPSY